VSAIGTRLRSTVPVTTRARGGPGRQSNDPIVRAARFWERSGRVTTVHSGNISTSSETIRLNLTPHAAWV
jgi:hypothetical protein